MLARLPKSQTFTPHNMTYYAAAAPPPRHRRRRRTRSNGAPQSEWAEDFLICTRARDGSLGAEVAIVARRRGGERARAKNVLEGVHALACTIRTINWRTSSLVHATWSDACYCTARARTDSALCASMCLSLCLQPLKLRGAVSVGDGHFYLLFASR